MGDWLQVYNAADFVPFIEALGRWPGSTILIKLMYEKTRLVSQIYQ